MEKPKNNWKQHVNSALVLLLFLFFAIGSGDSDTGKGIIDAFVGNKLKIKSISEDCKITNVILHYLVARPDANGLQYPNVLINQNESYELTPPSELFDRIEYDCICNNGNRFKVKRQWQLDYTRNECISITIDCTKNGQNNEAIYCNSEN